VPRKLSPGQTQKRAAARREGALGRAEFRYPSSPREAPAGPTSFPVKKIDMAAQAAIEAFLKRKNDASI
jgi:hypothetical protein